jgi:hypothetical protein
MIKTLKIVALAFLLFVNTSFAAEWTMFHGPDGENRSPDTGLLSSWTDSGPKLLWKIDNIGKGLSGYSSVTIQKDRLFTVGKEQKVWTRNMLTKFEGENIIGALAESVRIDGKRLYPRHGTFLYCYDIAK